MTRLCTHISIELGAPFLINRLATSNCDDNRAPSRPSPNVLKGCTRIWDLAFPTLAIMHFRSSLALLLASFVFTSLQLGVNAAPRHYKRAAVSITLPVRCVHQTRDVHPLVSYQQHANHAIRRWARMTGRAMPSDAELAQRLYKRISSTEEDGRLAKRYNRMGVPSRKKHRVKLAPGEEFAGTKAQNLDANTNDASDDKANTVTHAKTPTTPDSLGLDIEANDISYLAIVDIGTPPEKYSLIMDSGSADMWVGSENCVSEAGGGCGNHNFLGPQSSSSFVDTKQPFRVTYGTGNVAGTIVTDDLAFAGFSLRKHRFGVANQESVQFSDNSVPSDGLMGLAKSTLSQQKNLTPVESLAKEGLISEAVTSFKLSRLADGKNDGEITFGTLDTTKFDPKTLVTLDNVSKLGFWEAAMDDVTVDGQNAGLEGRTAILDTGTTLIVAPPADAIAAHKLIPGSKADGQGGFTIPCKTNASVILTFGGSEFAIDPRDIAFQPVDPRNPDGECISGIASGIVGTATEWLLGAAFLKNAYLSTNVNKNQVSLAKLL
ncbi:hypothetical protein APHAL10511_007376 [Amanita phalloides]|nr:hypothetical protein APHAL10511_007376 [Amanita phalloides]